MSNTLEYKDMFGRDIHVGDYIVYAAMDGQSATLRSGQVIELKAPKNWRGEAEPKLFVKSWSNWKGARNDGEGSGRQKNVTLAFLNRVVVVDPNTVSPKVKADLDGPICDWSGKPISTTI